VSSPEPTEGSAPSRSAAGPHRIHYLQWGAPDAERTVVCVHGVSMCAWDFEGLAPALAEAGYRVVCPDLVGRGDSDRLADPAGYGVRQYVSDMDALLDHLDLDDVDWVGTSLGGLIGMVMAARPDSPIRRLVLNDFGPFVPRAALQRIGALLGSDPRFSDVAAAEAYLRQSRASYGDLTDAQWRRMAEHATRPDGSGGRRLHYDPSIAINYRATSDRDTDVWYVWEAIRCPVLVLRGALSDLLTAETAADMVTRGPGAEVIEFAGCGHIPPLLDATQIDPVVTWLGPARLCRPRLDSR